MPVTVAYIPEQDHMEMLFHGNLDLTASPDVCRVCDRAREGLRACIIDLSGVVQVFDSGVALLHLLCQSLRAVGTQVVLRGLHPELIPHLAFITGGAGVQPES
jgi:anti-anti-sigma regulatory factor